MLGQNQTRGILCLLVAIVLSAVVDAQDQDIERQLAALELRHQAQLAALEERHANRIANLEGEIKNLRGTVAGLELQNPSELGAAMDGLLQEVECGHDHGQLGGRRPLHEAGPTIGLVADFLWVGSTQADDFNHYDQFVLRGIDFSVAGAVDEGLSYYFRLHLDVEELELEEAFAWSRDFLPADLQLRFGRFNLDHGKTSPMHEHELPFVDKPAVIQDFLGGSLRGTGIELHQELDWIESGRLRWSLALVNAPDADAHVIAGPLAGDHDHGHDDEAEFLGDRDWDHFAYNGRITALFDVGAWSQLQVGLSLLWAPERRTDLEEVLGNAAAGQHRDLAKLTVSLDLSFNSIDPLDGSGWFLQSELLFNQEESVESDSGRLIDRSAFGLQAWGEYHFDDHLSLGLGGGWFESRRVGDDSWDLGTWFTWRLSHENRLRVEVRYYDLAVAGDDEFLLMLQWTTTLGHHVHASTW